MKEVDLVLSPISRAIRLGGLVGRVGLSFFAEQALSYVLSDEKGRVRRQDKIIKNSLRIVDTLGKLRGAPMKLGQMLSLHENLLPKEAVPILALLQKAAPAVPREKIFETIEAELGEKRSLIREIEPVPFAAASIGQVHGAVLHDGRRIALKIQYPGIDDVVRSDMDNVDTLLTSLLSLFVESDPAPLVAEMRERLIEELDYNLEKAHMLRMAQLAGPSGRIIVPGVIDELCTRRVLAMERVDGLTADEACSERISQELRDAWGTALFQMFVAHLFRHRFLHADPNLGNFAFREDGRVVVYDYGCMKVVPEHIAGAYARLCRQALDGNIEPVPGILLEIGVRKTSGAPLPLPLIRAFYERIREPFAEGTSYSFTNQSPLYDQILDIWRANFSESLDTEFPKDIVFIDRTIVGLFGNLCRLGATANWRQMLEPEVTGALSTL